LNILPRINFFGVLTVLCSEIRHCAKRQNVTGHAKRRHNKQKLTEKRQTKCQPFAKLKELHADTQANAFAAHLILPNRTQSPPTTRQVDG
jgi:hypothetical protein